VAALDFVLPDLGEGLADAEVVRWLVAMGDEVELDQPLVEVLTAKANTELPSPFAGTVTALHCRPGDVVAVGSPLLTVETAGTAATPEEADGGAVLVGHGPRPGPPRPDRARRPRPGHPPAVISPVVRRLAQEKGVDLSRAQGTGPGGLILRADVEAAARVPEGDIPAPASGEAWGPPAGDGAPPAPWRGLHRRMAEQVARSRSEIPEATVWVDADATGLVEARDALARSRPGRPGPSFVALAMRFCVLGLERWPVLNGRVENGELVAGESVNMGFAAQTPAGLVVPVVRGAERLSLAELDQEVRRLGAAAREGVLSPGELTGGTFTVNNYGVFGVDGSAAIINYPEVAMLGIGRVAERPWVSGGEVVARPVTQLVLVFDHRVCDGSVAAGFLRFVADCVEQPLLAL
jgi:2-oxoisovalerate dehydrogenase E2 component (dihydrolipoyl transacylase)